MTLEEIDPIYRESVSQLTAGVRIEYCNKVIDKAQFVLEQTREYLHQTQKQTLRQKIMAAQQEIKRICENNVAITNSKHHS